MSSRAVVRALARAGLSSAEPLGHGAAGPRWAVRDADGRGWAVTVVRDAAARSQLRCRVAALTGLDHPHVARVAPLLELRDGSAVVLQAEVLGPDLLTVCRARGAWSAGEVVTLVVPLAEALAALHAVGVVHGDVAPANVVLEQDGRPVLVDLVCGADPAEAGTPGLAAPERAAGAGPAADVHALARLGLMLLGEPAAGAGALADVLRAAADADPDQRPTAARLAIDVFAACTPEPVRLPDAAVLARLTLRRLAGPPDDATVLVGRDTPRGRHRARRGVRAPVAVLVTGLALAGALAGVLRLDDAAGADALTPEPGVAGAGAAGPATAPPAVQPVRRQSGSQDPVTAAVRLTTERGRALADGDRARLAAVTVPGSAAAVADQDLSARVWAAGPVSGGVEVLSAQLLPGEGTPGTVRVRVVARTWVTTADPGPGPGSTAADVVLVLARADGRWRVSDVAPS